MTSDTWVEIRRCFDLGEAHIIKGLLESSGIPCFVLDEHHHTMAWHMHLALGGMRITVPASRVKEALDVLSKTATENVVTPVPDKRGWLPSGGGWLRALVSVFVYVLGGEFVIKALRRKKTEE